MFIFFLFQKVWLAILLSLIMVVLFVKIFNHAKFRLDHLSFMLFTPFMNQTSIAFEKYFKYNLRKGLLSVCILLIVWINVANVLSKSFSSVLLNTYFKTKPTLVVKSIEELISKPEVCVYGYLIDLEFIGQNYFKHLDQRLKSCKDPDKSKNENRDIMLDRISKGQAVHISDSDYRKLLMRIFPQFNLKIAENKYLSDHQNYLVSKKHHHHLRLYKM